MDLFIFYTLNTEFELQDFGVDKMWKWLQWFVDGIQWPEIETSATIMDRYNGKKWTQVWLLWTDAMVGGEDDFQSSKLRKRES